MYCRGPPADRDVGKPPTVSIVDALRVRAAAGALACTVNGRGADEDVSVLGSYVLYRDARQVRQQHVNYSISQHDWTTRELAVQSRSVIPKS